MVRTVGIDADDFAVKAVELDGSYRKSRLVGFRIDKVPLTADDETRAAAVAAWPRAALARRRDCAHRDRRRAHQLFVVARVRASTSGRRGLPGCDGCGAEGHAQWQSIRNDSLVVTVRCAMSSSRACA